MTEGYIMRKIVQIIAMILVFGTFIRFVSYIRKRKD